MPAVYIVADNIYSPIGTTTAQNFERVKQGISGIKKHNDKALSDEPVHASLFNFNENEYNKVFIPSLRKKKDKKPCATYKHFMRVNNNQVKKQRNKEKGNVKP